MRHRVRGKKLNMETHRRKAVFRGLLGALAVKGRLVTTESRAKAVQRLIEKLITKAKTGSWHSQKLVAGFLQNKAAVEKMVRVWGPKFKERKGGFTRIIRLGKRRGDDAMRARLEFVEQEQVKENEKNESNQGKGN